MFNEEKNIRSTFENVSEKFEQIVVVDSGSLDKSLEICAEFKDVEVFQSPKNGFSDKMNWALANVNFKCDWIFRLDADETITPKLFGLLEQMFSNNEIIHDSIGYYVLRKYYFMNKWIKFGTMYPVKTLRLWRKNKASCESRLLDEHMLVEGKVSDVSAAIEDRNQLSLSQWVMKHMNYALLEKKVIELSQNDFSQPTGDLLSDHQDKKRRWIKENIYYRMPLFFRAFIYYFYRYIIRFGFLDGKAGLVYHFLHGFWYRFMVDSLIYEEQIIKKRGEK